MTLDEYKAQIDRRIAAQRETLDEDVEACKRGVWCGERINLSAWTISIYRMVRADLDRIDWMQL